MSGSNTRADVAVIRVIVENNPKVPGEARIWFPHSRTWVAANRNGIIPLPAPYGVTDRLDLRLGNVFEGITGEFDLIVSNPPYVPDDQLEVLQAEVRQFEPHTALSGGASGLDVIERIIAEAQHFLVPGGVLLMEIGFDQSERVSGLFDTGIWSELKFLPDLQGIPRIVFARCR